MLIILLLLLCRLGAGSFLEWLLHLEELDGRHELAFGQEGIDLPHKFKGHIVFVEDERVKVLQHNGYLAALEENLQLVPVVLFLLVILYIFK